MAAIDIESSGAILGDKGAMFMLRELASLTEISHMKSYETMRTLRGMHVSHRS